MTRRQSSRSASLIGIWWDDGEQVVALTHLPAKDASMTAGLIDSHLEHWREWPDVALRLLRSAEDEYFCVPRGRVLLRRETDQGMTYHGAATTSARLELIASMFRLHDWKAAVDLHYEFGEAAGSLFDDD